jgi:tetratricopeptide (TPR) repeat protein
MVNYRLAYMTRNESPAESQAHLEKAVQASPRLVYPFRDEDVPTLTWVLDRNRDWKARYYLALIAWNKGLHRQAISHLLECKTEPDFGPFYIARAELLKKHGQAPPEEDYRRALDLAPEEWRTWLALARYHSEHSDFKEALEVSRQGFDKFPQNFILGMEYAKSLIDNSEHQDALDILDRLVVLPYENASEGRNLYEKAHLLLATRNIREEKFEEALGHIRQSREWPEHLGAGKPYDPDERLQDYVEEYCSDKLGRTAGRAYGIAEIRNLQAEFKSASPWKFDLMTTISR